MGTQHGVNKHIKHSFKYEISIIGPTTFLNGSMTRQQLPFPAHTTNTTAKSFARLELGGVVKGKAGVEGPAGSDTKKKRNILYLCWSK